MLILLHYTAIDLDRATVSTFGFDLWHDRNLHLLTMTTLTGIMMGMAGIVVWMAMGNGVSAPWDCWVGMSPFVLAWNWSWSWTGYATLTFATISMLVACIGEWMAMSD